MTADDDRKKSQGPQLPDLEDTELYQLLTEATEESMKKCLSVIPLMSRQEVNNRSKKTGNNYLHVLVQVEIMFFFSGSLVPPIIKMLGCEYIRTCIKLNDISRMCP